MAMHAYENEVFSLMNLHVTTSDIPSHTALLMVPREMKSVLPQSGCNPQCEKGGDMHFLSILVTPIASLMPQSFSEPQLLILNIGSVSIGRVG